MQPWDGGGLVGLLTGCCAIEEGRENGRLLVAYENSRFFAAETVVGCCVRNDRLVLGETVGCGGRNGRFLRAKRSILAGETVGYGGRNCRFLRATRSILADETVGSCGKNGETATVVLPTR